MDENSHKNKNQRYKKKIHKKHFIGSNFPEGRGRFLGVNFPGGNFLGGFLSGGFFPGAFFLEANIRLLGIELCKVKNNLSTHLMSEIFNLRNIDYNLHSQIDFKQGPVNTANYGLKSLRYPAPKIWIIIPLEI